MKKILIVCGKGGLVKVLKNLLASKYEESQIHCFFECNSPSEWIFREKIDLFFIDLQMFNGEGVDFLKKVRKIQPEAKIIGISSSRLHRKSCLKIGCDGFLAQRFSHNEFESEMKIVLEKSFLAEAQNELSSKSIVVCSFCGWIKKDDIWVNEAYETYEGDEEKISYTICDECKKIYNIN